MNNLLPPHYKKDESGVYFILSAFVLTVLVGMIALAVDIGMLYRDKLQLQKIADSAVAAGLAYDAIHRNNMNDQTRRLVIDAVMALNNQDVVLKYNDIAVTRNVEPDGFHDQEHQSKEWFKLAFKKDGRVEKQVQRANTDVIVPPQGIGVSITYQPRLYFSVLKKSPLFSSRVFATGQLAPANVALVLDFSGSMCCEHGDCGVSACSPINDAYLDDQFTDQIESVQPNSKASHLIVAVERFLQYFRNYHDHISFTLFNTVAETRNSMTDITFGRSAYAEVNRSITWYPDAIDEDNNHIPALPKNYIASPQNTWASIIFGSGTQDSRTLKVTGNTIFAGNTNPSDALIRAFLDTRAEKRIDGGILRTKSNLGDGRIVPHLAGRRNANGSLRSPYPVHYVFFTDGAPTAGRFFIPSSNNGTSRTKKYKMSANPNRYNPFELPFSGETCNGNSHCRNFGDYYNFKNKYIWERDASGTPTKYQYAASPLVYTAIYEGSTDNNDDDNISRKLDARTNKLIGESFSFNNLDMAQFGSIWEGKEVKGEEKKYTENGHDVYKYEGGTWSDYAWNDWQFKFLPPCTYGGTDRQTLTSGEYFSPADTPAPGITPAHNPTPAPEIDHEGINHAHYDSNYRLWFETANLGVCCALDGFCIKDDDGNCIKNSGDDLFKSVYGDLKDSSGNTIDLCEYTTPDFKICQEALDPRFPPLTAFPSDKVWDKMRRCLLPRTNGPNTVFRVPYSNRTFNRDLTDPSNDNWAKLYYDAAIEYADMIRDHNGVIYAIGLGDEPDYSNPTIKNDFYQNVHDDYSRHDYFLTRLTLDPYLFQINENLLQGDYSKKDLGCALKSSCNITGRTGAYNSKQIRYQQNATSGNTRAWNNWNVPMNNDRVVFRYGDDYTHRHQYGQYLPTDNPAELSDLFQQVARKILLSLAETNR